MKKIFLLLTVLMAVMSHKASAQQGEIIYTDFEPDIYFNALIGNTFNNQDTIMIDFNADEVTDFKLYLSVYFPGGHMEFQIRTSDGWKVRQMVSDDENDTIVPSESSIWGRYFFLYPDVKGTYDYTLGFRKQTQDGFYYVWLKLNHNVVFTSYYHMWVYIEDFAYCTIPNYPLRWGQTSLDVVEETDEIPLAIFPNPANSIVTVKGENIKTIELINITGPKVPSTVCNSDEAVIDLSGQPAGVYFINITDKNGRQSVKKIVRE